MGSVSRLLLELASLRWYVRGLYQPHRFLTGPKSGDEGRRSQFPGRPLHTSIFASRSGNDWFGFEDGEYSSVSWRRRKLDGPRGQILAVLVDTRHVNIPPDDALLEIFDFYQLDGDHSWTWHTLVHVCERWRTIVFRGIAPFGLATSPQARNARDLKAVPIISGRFLGGGFAPRWQSLSLNGIPFPELPSVLPSATHLVSLRLLGHLPVRVNQSRVACHRILPYPSPRAGSETPSSADTEYLDHFVARIDAPLLDHLGVTVFIQSDVEPSHLSQFIPRTKGGRHTLPNETVIHSKGSTLFVTLYQLGAASGDGNRQQFRLGVSCEALSVERLYIDAYFIWHGPRDKGNELELWPDILHPFKAVENLYVSETVSPHIAKALERVAKTIKADV
ncbi:hypothetical protein BJY52DRAFT_1226611 [Lactarius psammicola]|nr:hypothetical protein BJY52DRAFT_1226611 [Lactarius psammicola]